jgi:hypothetical protein
MGHNARPVQNLNKRFVLNKDWLLRRDWPRRPNKGAVLWGNTL